MMEHNFLIIRIAIVVIALFAAITNIILEKKILDVTKIKKDSKLKNLLKVIVFNTYISIILAFFMIGFVII